MQNQTETTKQQIQNIQKRNKATQTFFKQNKIKQNKTKTDQE